MPSPLHIQIIEFECLARSMGITRSETVTKAKLAQEFAEALWRAETEEQAKELLGERTAGARAFLSRLHQADDILRRYQRPDSVVAASEGPFSLAAAAVLAHMREAALPS